MPNKNSNRTPERAEKTLHALFRQNKKSESQLSYIEELLTMLSAYGQNELMWSEMPLDRRKAGRKKLHEPQEGKASSRLLQQLLHRAHISVQGRELPSGRKMLKL